MVKKLEDWCGPCSKLDRGENEKLSPELAINPETATSIGVRASGSTMPRCLEAGRGVASAIIADDNETESNVSSKEERFKVTMMGREAPNRCAVVTCGILVQTHMQA